jgi:hypothetical protein
MADLKKAQDEAVAYVNTAKAMVDKVLQIMEIFLVSPSMTVTYSRTPMDFIMKLLKEVGVSEEELIDFLTYILLGALPALEIGVKSILLTNLKNLISCSVDPRIPEKYRKLTVGGDSQDSQRRGIDIDITSIDFLDKLSVAPLSDAGKQNYFGIEGVNKSYQFARADDMDAFLWFVIHKGKFPFAATATVGNGSFTDNVHGTGAASVTPQDATLLSAFEVNFPSNSPSKILPGNVFTYKNSRIYSMCVESIYDDADNIIHNTILPISDDKTSVNWYIRRADQLSKNIGIGWNSKKPKSATKTGRDYSKERAICNLQYMQHLPQETSLVELVDNKFRFTILPKPYVHIPYIDITNIKNSEPPWRFKKILFDDKGNLDSNGKFTLGGIPSETFNASKKVIEIRGGIGRDSYTLELDIKSGEIKFGNGTTPATMVKNVIECYPGLTVYEFNYDYVMGMKLFDAKTIATTLFNNIMDIRLGLSADISIKHQEATDEIKSIINEIIETDDSEVSDC